MKYPNFSSIITQVGHKGVKIHMYLTCNFLSFQDIWQLLYMFRFMTMVLENSRYSHKYMYKNWKEKLVFFFSSTRLSTFYCCPFHIFSVLLGIEAAFRSCEIKVKYGWFWQIIDTFFINLVIYRFGKEKISFVSKRLKII